jgi:hypothetical protein
MKTNLIKLVCAVIAAISCSCSSESDDTVQQEASLSQTVISLPQMEGYTHKHVVNYADNRIVSEIDYDGGGTMTGRKETTYGPGTMTTISSYSPDNIYLGKKIYNYDASGRISTMEFYDSQNQQTTSRQYVYEGNDINVFFTENGVSTLSWIYRTNSDNLLCYEKRIAYPQEQIVNYINQTPSELFMSEEGNPDLVHFLNYEFYPTAKPLVLQNSITEMNNYSLIGLSIQQIHETSNYYLKKAYRPNTAFYFDYYKEFDSNNYIIYAKTSIVTSNGPTVNSERFYYYN